MYDLKPRNGTRGLSGEATLGITRRIDPLGLRGLTCRAVGRNRLEVLVPVGDPKTTRKKNAYSHALERLERRNIPPGDVRHLTDVGPQARQGEISRLASGDSNLENRLVELCSAYDAMVEGRKKGPNKARNIAEYENTTHDYLGKLGEVLAANIDREGLQAVLTWYVSTEDAALFSKREAQYRMEVFEQQLEKFRNAHPSRAADIDEAVRRYIEWAHVRYRATDPQDVTHLLLLISKERGLEFRITPSPYDGDRPIRPTDKEMEHYRDALSTDGPQAVRKQGGKYAWFPLHDESGFDDFVRADHAGKTYILLCNEPDKVMLQEPGKVAWRIRRAYPERDNNNRPAIGFEFNEAGARLFADLTGRHIRRPMAILLDDEVYSSPVIRSAISKKGIITGVFTPQEVLDLARTLETGSSQSRIKTPPVCVRELGPGEVILGSSNFHRAALGVIGATVVVLLGMGAWGIGSARVNWFGISACLVVGAAHGWWEFAAHTDGDVAGGASMMRYVSAVLLVLTLAVWQVARLLASRRQKPAGGQEEPPPLKQTM